MEDTASTNKRECMIIASFGDQLPPGVNAVCKPLDKDRASECHKKMQDNETRWTGGGERGGLRKRSSASRIAPPPPILTADIDLRIVQDLITADTSKELVSVNSDLPGRQRTRHYYLKKIEDFLKFCQEPGGRPGRVAMSSDTSNNCMYKHGWFFLPGVGARVRGGSVVSVSVG